MGVAGCASCPENDPVIAALLALRSPNDEPEVGVEAGKKTRTSIWLSVCDLRMDKLWQIVGFSMGMEFGISMSMSMSISLPCPKKLGKRER